MTYLMTLRSVRLIQTLSLAAITLAVSGCAYLTGIVKAIGASSNSGVQVNGNKLTGQSNISTLGQEAHTIHNYGLRHVDAIMIIGIIAIICFCISIIIIFKMYFKNRKQRER